MASLKHNRIISLTHCVLLLCQFHGVRLDAIFEMTRLQNKFIKYKVQKGVDYPGTCALECESQRFESPSPCLAFYYNSERRKCFYFTKSDTPANSVAEAFVFKATDKLHDINIDGQTFSLYLSSTGKTFDEARAHCHALGGHLLEFDSFEEKQALQLLVMNAEQTWAMVGISDKADEGRWVTDREGETISDPLWQWGLGQPNNGDMEMDEHCAVLNLGSLQLADVSCHLNHSFLCERD